VKIGVNIRTPGFIQRFQTTRFFDELRGH